MNKKEYLAKRKALLEAIATLINEGKVEEANAKMAEVEALDSTWESIALAHANRQALEDRINIDDIENGAVDPGNDVTPVGSIESGNLTREQIYTNAFANELLGNALTSEEQKIFDEINTAFENAFTHTTANTGILIPETMVAGIFKRAEEMYPLYADAKKFNVSGKLKFVKHKGIKAGDAAWYDEATPTADEENEFGELVLDGHELSKAVSVSWKLKSMAVEDFIPFLTNELGERIGVALGTAAAQGKGKTQKQATGVETALKAETDKPQVIAMAKTGLTYGDLTEAISRIHSGYINGAAIYANNTTIWKTLANLMDANKRPLFIPDVTAGGVGRILGYVVKADAGVSDGCIIIGNAAQGLVFNVNEPLSIVIEDHAKQRQTDYVAYTIVDGDVFDTKAFVLLEPTPGP